MKRFLTLASLLLLLLAAQSCIPDSMCACPPAMPPPLEGVVIDEEEAPVQSVAISLWTDAGDVVAEATTDRYGRFHFPEEAVWNVPLEVKIDPPEGYRVADDQPHPVEVLVPVGYFEFLVLRVQREP